MDGQLFAVWIAIFILSTLCVLEGILLIKDQGIVANLLEATFQMAARKGWKAVGTRILYKLYGKSLDIAGQAIDNTYQDDHIHIAFQPTGGFGDYIISAKILEELQEMCNCKIDVFVEKKMFGKSIYGKRNNVSVLNNDEFERVRHQYDLALRVEHFIHVLNWQESRVEKLSNKLYEKINYIIKNWNDLYVNIGKQCWRERVQFERCRTLGLNRWTELRMGKAFSIKNLEIMIPLEDSYRAEFILLGLDKMKYITINYGADAMCIGKTQLKLWPKEYYEELILLLKGRYKDVKIIQLGSADAEPVAGVDICFLGKSIELTKWILRQSACHIDCEGGLVHLATQLKTKCIVIFGPTPVHMYGYSQNINLYSEKCNNCMGLHESWAYDCYKGFNAAICMSDVLPQRVFKELQIILNN